MTEIKQVPWPETSEELGAPITAWLADLNLLEDPSTRVKWNENTPLDKQAITAGATFISKISAPLVGASGLGTALVAFIKGWSASTVADWILLACATLLVSFTIIAVAWIVHADLDARASASAAQYEARAAAANAYLQVVGPTPHRRTRTSNTTVKKR